MKRPNVQRFEPNQVVTNSYVNIEKERTWDRYQGSHLARHRGITISMKECSDLINCNVSIKSERQTVPPTKLA